MGQRALEKVRQCDFRADHAGLMAALEAVVGKRERVAA
jgi:hypothetical protein